MRLKQLKLAGFKSFANPTTFTFKHNITAIVGPNGCGKSNVIDAMRWVLGETRAKQLRGGAMSDVIFAGVEGRAGKSMASVELTFEHTQDEKTGIRHALNLYHELTLRRQVHKDGRSDYFINGQQVRRRDVVDVFLGTGLGAKSYAVIEQGMIGRIIEADGAKLREFIEEAAGVSRYQARRSETQAQLSATSENLARLNDLQSELSKQQKSLQKQAKSAHQYQMLQSELALLNKQTLLQKLFTTWQELQQADDTHQNIQTQKQDIEQKLQTLDGELTLYHQELQQLTTKKNELKETYHKAQLDKQTLQHEFLSLQNDIQRTEDALNKLLQTQENHQKATDSAKASLQQIQQDLATLNPQMTDVEQKLSDAQSALQTAQNDHQSVKQTLNKLNAQKHEYQHAKSLAQSHQDRLKNELNKWEKKHSSLISQSKNIPSEQIIKDDLQTLAQLTCQIDECQKKLHDLQNDDDKKADTDKLKQTLQTKQQNLQTLQQRHAVLQSEQATLTSLLQMPSNKPTKTDHHDIYQDCQTLQSLIRLSKQGENYAEILDQFLGFWLSSGVLDEKQLPKIPTAAPQDKALSAILTACHTPILPVGLPDNVLPLDVLIESPRLTLWQGVYLWTGVGAVPVLDDGMVLTQEGWLFGAFGAVHISRLKLQSTFLSNQLANTKRLDDIKSELTVLLPQIEHAKKDVEITKEALTQLENAKEKRHQEKQLINQHIYDLKEKHTKLSTKIDKDKFNAENHHKNLKELTEQKQEWQNELSDIENEFNTHQKKLDEILMPLQDTQNALKALTHTISRLHDDIAKLNKEKQSLAIKHTALTQNHHYAQKVLSSSQSTQKTTHQEIEQLSLKKDNLNHTLPNKQKALTQATISAQTLDKQCDELEKSAQALNDKISELKETRNTIYAKLSDVDTQAVALVAQKAVAQSRLQDLSGQCVGMDDGFDLAATLDNFVQNPPKFTDLTAKIAKTTTALEKLGAVNLAAAEELAQLGARMSPLQAQIDDITASMNTLQNAISAIDEKTKTLFLGMLQAVNQTLGALFAKVFGGGQASLTLMDDESLSKADKWRAGLELMAQPKGKKNTRLAVLSGGEKTLTALSLIFAIFKQHPAPFCVLDEVDAPLDDANVGRFTALIEELSKDVQFIFISHNKLSMQIADELKGITMPTAGISSLVTVSLGEVEKYLN